ncbi:hypothetical protein UPYG_G00274480 [Umbra pygmaea]|uniref:Fucolectin tachylectin-4 pentraxin-1 domain-containing protein n=1 Tax=Umbra pygmaea TaxID=75934 RepID=A0ABD0W3P7_UMBPY
MMRQSLFFLLLVLLETSSDAFIPKNLALRGRATQSSLVQNPWAAFGDAQNAIDGNRNANYDLGSCTATDWQADPWWRVDLLDVYTVTTINIINRGDCCPERINGAEIRIGNSLQNDSIYNELAGVISSIPAGDNVALYGKAAQSSLHSLGVPNNAIDGNRNGIWKVGSCTHTELELNPWWRVDLLKTYKVFSVTITNTLDSIPSRLNGAEIHIGDSLKDNGINNPRCAVISSIPGGTSSTFQCNGMEGRYVIVVIPGRNEYLTLCEVEVFGSPLEGKSE